MFHYLVYPALMVVGWFMRQLWEIVKELKTDLHILREEIAKEYVPKVDFNNTYMTILNAIKDVHNELKAHEIREMAWHEQTISRFINK